MELTEFSLKLLQFFNVKKWQGSSGIKFTFQISIYLSEFSALFLQITKSCAKLSKHPSKEKMNFKSKHLQAFQDKKLISDQTQTPSFLFFSKYNQSIH